MPRATCSASVTAARWADTWSACSTTPPVTPTMAAAARNAPSSFRRTFIPPVPSPDSSFRRKTAVREDLRGGVQPEQHDPRVRAVLGGVPGLGGAGRAVDEHVPVAVDRHLVVGVEGVLGDRVHVHPVLALVDHVPKVLLDDRVADG